MRFSASVLYPLPTSCRFEREGEVRGSPFTSWHTTQSSQSVVVGCWNVDATLQVSTSVTLLAMAILASLQLGNNKTAPHGMV